MPHDAQTEGQARTLHDALRILARRQGGWLPSPHECWSPGEWIVVLTALVSLVVRTPTLNSYLGEAEQRCENLRKRATSGAKMSARSFQVSSVREQMVWGRHGASAGHRSGVMGPVGGVSWVCVTRRLETFWPAPCRDRLCRHGVTGVVFVWSPVASAKARDAEQWSGYLLARGLVG